MSNWNPFRDPLYSQAQPSAQPATGPVSPENVCRRLCQQALLWERYLYEDHTRKQLSSWAMRLQYFRFCRAYGGHSNDGDQLIAVLKLTDEAALQATCHALGIELLAMPEEAYLAAMPPGRRPTASRDFPNWRQPGKVHIAGAPIYAWLTGHRPKDATGRLTGESIPSLELSLADPDDIWNVTEAAVLHAEAVEKLFQPVAVQILDPPHDDRNCISPRRYPEMFGLWQRATAEWPWDQPDPH